MDAEIAFFFYLGAVLCFLVAALGEGWRYGSRTRRGLKPALTFLPFGLALAVVPTLWAVGVEAF